MSVRLSNFEAAQTFADFGLADRDAGNRESASGPGSSRIIAQKTIELLNSTINAKNIRSILDLGCGDWNWMADVDLSQPPNGAKLRYQGWDASEKLVDELTRKYGIADEIEFNVRDITTAPLPKVDLIIARDVLFHLPIEIAVPLVNRIKLSCAYLVSTSFFDSQTNTDIAPYNAIEGWGYYKINLNIPPFSLSQHLDVAYREKPEKLGAAPRYICLYDFTETRERDTTTATSIKAPAIARQSGPQVSVIIPCYNGADFVKQSVASIRNQTCDSWELLLMDDASTDATVDQLILEADRDRRIKPLFGEANLGPSVRRNRGMDNATGRFIMFADSDDLLLEDALERLLEIAERDNADVVRGSHMQISRNKQQQLNQLEQFHQSEMCGIRYQDCPSLVQLYTSWNMLISRQLVRQHGLRFKPELKIGEDRIFNQTIFDSARRISMTKQTTYLWDRGRNPDNHLSMVNDLEQRFCSITTFMDTLSGLRGATEVHLRIARRAMTYEAANCLVKALRQNESFELIEKLREYIRAQNLNAEDLADQTIKGRASELLELIQHELGIDPIFQR